MIANPVDDAERKINSALQRMDASVLKATKDCFDTSQPTSWERTVDVPMLGPRYISYTITDISSCGGPHPDVSKMSIVYDLTTGKPVDWTTLLPNSLTGKLALEPGADGTKMVTLSGPEIYALYLTGYRPVTGVAKKDAEDADCRDEIVSRGQQENVPRMMVWLDAKKDGLVVQLQGLVHAVQGCADEVIIPTAALRAIGAQSTLVAALARAHGQSKDIR
jgi:hypothetical protein